jgi:polar amino acid transport system substrate-binding protein
LYRRWAKAFAAAGLLLALALAAGACGSSDESKGSGTSGSASASTSSSAAAVVAKPPASELVRPGTLSICTETGTPPAAYYDDQNELAGYLPALGEGIAARMGLKTNWVDSVFDTIIVAANTGKCDIVIADQFITPEREAQITMIPYAKVGQQLMTTIDKADELADATTDPAKLCGRKVAVLSGAAEADTLSRWSARCASGKIDVVIFSNTPAGLQALQGGQADAFFTDSPVSGYYAEEQKDQFAVAGEPVENVQAGVAIPRDKTGLQATVRKVLAAMSEDGSYKQIFARFGEQAMVIENPGQQ